MIYVLTVIGKLPFAMVKQNRITAKYASTMVATNYLLVCMFPDVF